MSPPKQDRSPPRPRRALRGCRGGSGCSGGLRRAPPRGGARRPTCPPGGGAAAETCPVSTGGGARRVRVSTGGGTRRVHLVRGGGGGGGGTYLHRHGVRVGRERLLHVVERGARGRLEGGGDVLLRGAGGGWFIDQNRRCSVKHESAERASLRKIESPIGLAGGTERQPEGRHTLSVPFHDSARCSRSPSTSSCAPQPRGAQHPAARRAGDAMAPAVRRPGASNGKAPAAEGLQRQKGLQRQTWRREG